MDFLSLKEVIKTADLFTVGGSVREVVGLGLRALLPGTQIGEMVTILRRQLPPLSAEVVGFAGDEVVLMALGDLEGVSPGDKVVPTRSFFSVPVGPALLGRVVDGLGQPIDGKGPIQAPLWPVLRSPPNPMERPPIDTVMSVGIRAIDGLLTVGKGQRIGLFAGSGVGKSTLLGQIARQADADVFVVCLVGERGRELREFLDESLGPEALARGVVVCATSDAPPLVRMKSAYVATAMAEYFRDQGRDVLLMMDSVTRFARSGREVGLAAGEPPVRRGFPPSVFAKLPGLLERTGRSKKGSITAFYTVLVEGGDMEEPIADEVRGILDAHIVLDREIGTRGRWPAIDVLHSISRVMGKITTESHQSHAASLKKNLGTYESKRELITLGAYTQGADPNLDAVLAVVPAIEQWLGQKPHETSGYDETLEGLASLASRF